jgi:hypothetical protein
MCVADMPLQIKEATVKRTEGMHVQCQRSGAAMDSYNSWRLLK